MFIYKPHLHWVRPPFFLFSTAAGATVLLVIPLFVRYMFPFAGLFERVITLMKVYELQWIEKEARQEVLAVCELNGVNHEKVGVISVAGVK